MGLNIIIRNLRFYTQHLFKKNLEAYCWITPSAYIILECAKSPPLLNSWNLSKCFTSGWNSWVFICAIRKPTSTKRISNFSFSPRAQEYEDQWKEKWVCFETFSFTLQAILQALLNKNWLPFLKRKLISLWSYNFLQRRDYVCFFYRRKGLRVPLACNRYKEKRQ